MKGLSREKILQNENKHLKDLLEQVYQMSCLDDMITDGCLDRNDDEMLLCNLSLKSEILEALKDKESLLEGLKKTMTNGFKFINKSEPIKIDEKEEK